MADREKRLKVRGTVSIAVVALGLVAADLVQRTVITASVKLLPRKRESILAAWQQLLASFVLGSIGFLGGARIGRIPRIPAGEGVLVLMNHQSLLDIPLVVRSLRPGYPRIVTRERYASGKPLISHMVRLYQYPTVNPRSTVQADLERLGEMARTSPTPLVIYPEGTRTRDGRIGRFKRSGLRAILGTRRWQVWMAVADGYWECAKLVDFRANVARIQGDMKVDGPFDGPAPEASPEEVDAFIDEMEERMRQHLGEMRGDAA